MTAITYNTKTYTVLATIVDGTAAQWIIGDANTSVGYDSRENAARFAVFRFLYNDDPTLATPIRVRTTNFFKYALEHFADIIDSRNACTNSTRVASPSLSATQVGSVTNVSGQVITLTDNYPGCPAKQIVTDRWVVADAADGTRKYTNLRWALRRILRRTQATHKH